MQPPSANALRERTARPLAAHCGPEPKGQNGPLPMNRTARRPGAQQVEGGRRMGRILTVLPPFELLRSGTGRGSAKPRFRGSKRVRPVRGILSPFEL
jgi:hypothetical protein